MVGLCPTARTQSREQRGSSAHSSDRGHIERVALCRYRVLRCRQSESGIGRRVCDSQQSGNIIMVDLVLHWPRTVAFRMCSSFAVPPRVMISRPCSKFLHLARSWESRVTCSILHHIELCDVANIGDVLSYCRSTCWVSWRIGVFLCVMHFCHIQMKKWREQDQ